MSGQTTRRISMISCMGMILLICVIVGGFYLYRKIDQIDNEIASQEIKIVAEKDDETS